MKTRMISAIIAALMLTMMAGCSVPAGANATPAVSGTVKTEATPTITPSTASDVPASAIPTIAPEESPAPTPTAKPDPITVTERTLVYSNEYVNVNMRYPEIAGMADAVVQGGVNEGVAVYLQDMANNIETSSEEDAASGPHGVYAIESNYDIKRNDGGILSIRINISYYSGGANTGSDCAFINVINSDPAQQPVLADLFAPGTDYATVLNESISALIAADPYADSVAFEGVSSSQWYCLTDTALVIVFPRYSIAAGMYGEPEFSIPLAELSAILNTDIF